MGTDMRGFKVVYKERVYNALEMVDKIRDEAGREHTITDIVALHSMKEMQVRFVYELDNSGKLVNLMAGPQREGVVQNG